MESYEKIKKVLALGFMNFLDDNKSKGKMCLSNGECADIEKAFNEQDWPRLAGYLDKYTESEDERIRQGIVETIKQCTDILDPKNQKRMLDWLEKQKEQKPADYPYLPGWRKNRDDNKPELKRSVLMLTTHGVAEGEWLGKKWCQYRWSCELKDDDVLYWMHLSDLARLEKEDEQKEQKPSWSKEDEENFKWFDKFFRAESVIAGGRDIPQDKYLWFKSLRPVKQEWSEEDDATIKSAVHWLEKYLSTIRAKDVSSATQDGILTVKTTITNLKSLPSSWKPSEEQMEALMLAIEGKCLPTSYMSRRLEDLYEQLEKL